MRRCPAGCTVIQITFATASGRLVFRKTGRLSMKRFFYLVVLMALSSSAHAGSSFSFVVGGHRIRIEAPRDCNSPSCVSVSIPGIYETRGGRDRYDDIDDASDAAAPAKPPAVTQQQVSTPPIVQPASKPAVEPVASASPPPAVAQVAATACAGHRCAAAIENSAGQRAAQNAAAQSLPVTPAADTVIQAVPPAPAPRPVQVFAGDGR